MGFKGAVATQVVAHNVAQTTGLIKTGVVKHIAGTYQATASYLEA